MQNIDSKEIIKDLGSAGEGISISKMFIGRYILFPTLNYFISWDKAWEIYDAQGREIIARCSGLNKEMLFKRVLVPKLFGLEDNSRYYSIAMVIEHLLIVGNALVARIPILSQGKRLEKEVKIEDVKPYKDIDENIVFNFEEFLNRYREELKKNTKDIHINNRSKHPWFGEFNPKEWSILGMVHQIVHRRQIESILKLIK